MQVDADVGRAHVVGRWLDVADRAHRRQVGDGIGEVVPGGAAVARQVHQAVVRAGPDHAGLERRFGDGEEHARVGRTHVFGRQAAGLLLPAPVVPREIRADHLPALPAVRRHVHELAADIHAVVVVGRDRDRERPLEPVGQFGRRPSLGIVRPDADVAGVAGLEVVALKDAVVAARPDDVVLHRVGNGEARLAAADRVHQADRDAARLQAVARHSGGRAVLAVAVDVVGNPVVGVGVVHLSDRQPRPPPLRAAGRRDRHAAVVADDHPVGQQRVDPHVVVVTARRAAFDREAAIERDRVAGRHEVDLVTIVRSHRRACVVERPLRQRVVGVDHAPGLSAVVRAPEHAGVLVEFGEVAVRVRLDQRVDPVRVVGRHRQADLADRLVG